MTKEHSSFEVGSSQHPVSDREDAKQDEEALSPRFNDVLAQLHKEKITNLASSARHHCERKSSFPDTTVPIVACEISEPPLGGSYNLVYKIVFEDGVCWMLKIPATGHPRCHNALAAHTMRTEVETMRFIKDHIDIPLPTVYDYDDSMDNEIGCPYILMEFIDGVPLWQAWFNDDASRSRQECIRLRAMQTLAAAMVKLSSVTFRQSGALRVDSRGVNIVHSGSTDHHATHPRDRDPNDSSRDDIHFAKEPCSSALSDLLSMLKRRGIKSCDRALDRGGQRSIDSLTRWACEHLKINDNRFVLAHPDLDTQNILVKEDGTLSGIIDWDGVTVVPIAIGALKYPVWLMRDWNPACYNYDHETEGPLRSDGRTENSPEELIRYRAAYAHSIEMASLMIGMTSEHSRLNAVVTRASLVIGSLELAASNPYMTRSIVANIFNEMEDVAERLEMEDTSDNDSASSEDSSEDDDEDADVSSSGCESDGDEINDEENSDETRSTELDVLEVEDGDSSKDIICPRCLAEERARRGNPSETEPNIAMDSRDSQGQEVQDYDSILKDRSESTDRRSPHSTCGANSSTNRTQSKKTTFAQLLCGLGEKGCRGLASTLHQKNQGKSSVDIMSIEERSHSEPMTTKDGDFEYASNNTRSAGTLCEAIQKLLHNCCCFLHEVTDFDTEANHKPQEKSIQEDCPTGLLSWVLRKLKAIMGYLTGHKKGAPAVENPEVPGTDLASENLLERDQPEEHAVQQDVSPPSIAHADTILTVLNHVDKCPKAAKPKQDDREVPNEVDLSDVWDRIHFEVVHNAKIPVQMIKENQAWIADQIIEEMRMKLKIVRDREEAEANQKELEAKRVARKNRKARKDAQEAEGAFRGGEKAEIKDVEAEPEEEQTSSHSDAAQNASEEMHRGFTRTSSSQIASVTGPNTAEGAERVGAAVKDSAVLDDAVAAGFALEEPPEKSNHGSSQKEATRSPLGDEKPGQDSRSCISTNSPRRVLDNRQVPRGSPCPCGSRHKFKKCCGKAQDTGIPKMEHQEPVPSLSPSLVANVIASPGHNSSSQGVTDQVHDDDSNEHRQSAVLDGIQHVEPNGLHLSERDTSSHCDELDFTVGGRLPEEDGTLSYDKGGMGMAEIFVAWGRGVLDETRCDRLKQRFIFLLSVTMGVV